MAFSGFGDATVRYLQDLSANNSKAWFDAHRADYQAHYLAPAIAFVQAVEAPLSAIVPGIAAEARVNGSIFRINRDIRFSKDKTPYKNHIDLWFWVGARKTPVSAMFMRLAPDSLILGGGVHGFDSPRLARFRQAVIDPVAGPALAAAASAVEDAGLDVLGSHYKTMPRGFSASTPAAERFLKHNGLYGSWTGPHPETLGTPEFLDACLARWSACLPLHAWLLDLG